ncbi:N-acetyltransferase [Taibaiella sp. KBW10]|nr:N-acetyltransferase [Taibaiella sp. KBW10]
MEAFYAIDQYPIDPVRTQQMLHTFLQEETLGKAWLIMDNAEAIGYTILTFVWSFEYGGRIAFLDELYISDKARGKGAGGASVAFIKTQQKALDLKIIYLEIEPHNAPARTLYQKYGFLAHTRELMILK